MEICFGVNLDISTEKACVVRAIQAFSVDMSAASIFIQESPLQAQADPESVFRA